MRILTLISCLLTLFVINQTQAQEQETFVLNLKTLKSDYDNKLGLQSAQAIHEHLTGWKQVNNNGEYTIEVQFLEGLNVGQYTRKKEKGSLYHYRVNYKTPFYRAKVYQKTGQLVFDETYGKEKQTIIFGKDAKISDPDELATYWRKNRDAYFKTEELKYNNIDSFLLVLNGVIVNLEDFLETPTAPDELTEVIEPDSEVETKVIGSVVIDEAKEEAKEESTKVPVPAVSTIDKSKEEIAPITEAPKPITEEAKEAPSLVTQAPESTNEEVKEEPTVVTQESKPTTEEIKEEPTVVTQEPKPTTEEVKEEPTVVTQEPKPTNEEAKEEPAKVVIQTPITTEEEPSSEAATKQPAVTQGAVTQGKVETPEEKKRRLEAINREWERMEEEDLKNKKVRDGRPRHFRVGARFLFPNLVGAHAEVVLPFLNNRFSIVGDFSQISLQNIFEPFLDDGESIDDDSYYRYYSAGVNFYFRKKYARGWYMGASYLNGIVNTSDNDFTGKADLDAAALRFGLNTGRKAFMFGFEIGAGVPIGNLTGTFITQNEDAGPEVEILDKKILLIPILNITVAVAL